MSGLRFALWKIKKSFESLRDDNVIQTRFPTQSEVLEAMKRNLIRDLTTRDVFYKDGKITDMSNMVIVLQYWSSRRNNESDTEGVVNL